MTPESRLHVQITRLLAAMRRAGEPIIGLKVHGSPTQAAGWPDWLIVYRGRVAGIEGKASGKKATPLQAEIGRRIMEAGGFWVVVETVGQVREILESMRTA